MCFAVPYGEPLGLWAHKTQRSDMKRVEHGSRYRHAQCGRKAGQSARAFFFFGMHKQLPLPPFFFRQPAHLVSVTVWFPQHLDGVGLAWRCSPLHVEGPLRREPSAYQPQPVHVRSVEWEPVRAEPCDRDDMQWQTKATPATLSDAQRCSVMLEPREPEALGLEPREQGFEVQARLHPPARFPAVQMC